MVVGARIKIIEDLVSTLNMVARVAKWEAEALSGDAPVVSRENLDRE